MIGAAARVELLGLDAIAALVAHRRRVAATAGRDDEPASHPRSGEPPPTPSQLAASFAAAWRRPLRTEGWARGFGVSVDGAVRGHLTLTGPDHPAGLHRVELGMAIEPPWRGAGWGGRLVADAIGWASAAGLRWIDLHVFAHNHAARALYARHGFAEVGRVADAFRIDARSIDALAMARRL